MVKCRKQKQSKNKIYITDDQTIAKFQMHFNKETWYTVYNGDNVNRML